MTKLEDLFIIRTARSAAYDDHESGNIPFVSNGLVDNGVVGLVTPLQRDQVYRFTGLCVSTFSEATVHKGPFIARGNGGSGLAVLEPREPMGDDYLVRIAAFINNQVRWRFNWYRQVTVGRLRLLQLPDDLHEIGVVNRQVLPRDESKKPFQWILESRSYRLDELFALSPGTYHALDVLESGDIPVISCSDTNNGIAGYYSVDAYSLHQGKLTIALNGTPLMTKWHPYTFAGKDDVAICTPRLSLQLPTLLFIQAMLNRERWRFSYYRKCYIAKLQRYTIPLPVNKTGIDNETISRILLGTPYWEYVKRNAFAC